MSPGVASEVDRDHLSAELDSVRRLLLEPSAANLACCEAPLETLCTHMRGLYDQVRAAGPPEAEERLRLRGLLQSIRTRMAVNERLLHNAAGIRLGWARILLAAADSYTARGEATPLPARPAFSLDG